MVEKGVCTNLLNQWQAGDAFCLEKLMELVYQELNQKAAGLMARERVDHTLQPAALVHEVYLRMFQAEEIGSSRTQFLAHCANVMRQVLIDHARKKLSEKRGGPLQWVSIYSQIEGEQAWDILYLDLERALEELQVLDERKTNLVVLRFFGGLSIAEAAQALDISQATAKREWTFARTWLYSRLTHGPETSDPSQSPTSDQDA